VAATDTHVALGPRQDGILAQPAGPGSGMAPGQDASAVYSLGSSQGERARLCRQAGELVPESSALLDRVGLRPGQSAIDLGCGPRGILDLLAGRVSPGGHVVGLDADPALAAMAAEFAAERRLDGVQILTADARGTGLPSASFDLVHTRTLLINVPEPAEVVTEMARLARPDGWVASMEYDMEHALCYPPHPAFTRICEIFTAAFSRHGADPRIGRRVPELFRTAGLTEVEVEARAPVYPPGHSRRMIRADLIQAMRPCILQLGLASAAELDDLDTAVRQHLADAGTVTVSALLFLVWGRKRA
jgi:ubiquinone/menaquinone biosynthesis C-methylase UbiE